MRTYSREQAAYLLHLPKTSIDRYCQGFYYYKKQRLWYYEDAWKVEPVEGLGTKAHPWKYTLKSFRDYIKGL